MSYSIDRTESVEKSLRHAARAEIESTLSELADDELDAHEKVHQVRKRCKKIRALARLVRASFDDYSSANAAFRDVARRLSELRDAKVRVDTFDELVELWGAGLDEEALAPVRAALVEERERTLERQRDRLDAARGELETLAETADTWTLDADGFDAVAGGFLKTYRRARRAMDAAYDEPTAEHFHEWRKRVKYHRYHVRLLVDLWPSVFDTWRESLHDLTDLLGEGNDLGELIGAGDPLGAAGEEVCELIVTLAESRRADLWDEAADLGERLFQDSEEVVLERLGTVWAATPA